MWNDPRLHAARSRLKTCYEALDATLNHRDRALAREAIEKLRGALDTLSTTLDEAVS